MTQSPQTMQLAGRADWTLMTAIHDALRRDLDQLLHTTASHPQARARWTTFHQQLRSHLAAEHTAMWPRARPKLAGNPHGQALLDALDDERQLLGPLPAVIDDAFTMHADPRRLRHLLTRLRTRLASHLAHEETGALPLISQVLYPRELRAVTTALYRGHSTRRAAATLPWALTGATPGTREHILSQLPAPTRLLYRTAWQPRHSSTIPPL
jgi:hypothetical protein